MLKYIGLISSVFGHWNHTYGHIYSPEPKKHMINGVFAPNEVVLEKNTEWLERVHHSQGLHKFKLGTNVLLA